MEMSDCLLAFLASRKASNRRKATITNYEALLRPFIDHCSEKGLSDFEAITPVDIRDYLAGRIESGLMSSSVESQRNVLIIWISWLCEEGYVDDLDWKKRIKKIKVDDSDPRFLNADECQRLIAASTTIHIRDEDANKRDGAIIRIMLDTGVRASELVSMKLADVDMISKSIRIPADSKGRKERTVYFGAESLRALRAYLKVRGKIIRRITDADIKQYLWLSRYRKNLCQQYLWTIVSKSAAAANLKDVHPHSLRHTCATMLLKNGMPVTHVQKILGHATLTMTMQYVHLINDDVKNNFFPACPVDNLAA